MRVSEFRYDLPERLIAQEPAAERDASRLLVLDRAAGRTEHRVFRDLPEYLRPGDLLVLNDTRVLPARMTALKPTGGRVEVLLLERLDAGGGAAATASGASDVTGTGRAAEAVESGRAVGGPADARQEWRALVRGFPGGEGPSRFAFGGSLTVEIAGREGGGEVVRIVLTAPGGVERALEEVGIPPTPPYIRRQVDDSRLREDRERYQTVYAAAAGAVAAPTAGLHFTPSLLERIRAMGVVVESLTLHVGWGTFKPVRVERVEEHTIDPEPYVIPPGLADAFAAARRRGGRLVAVGTTVARALEFAVTDGGLLRPGSGRCDLFIHPGHRFRAVDALLTNFHLPESSLLMLAAAFAGREAILRVYREAVEREYRFYSCGDAMLIL